MISGAREWRIPAAGGTPVQMTTNVATDRHADWSPTSTVIVFSADVAGVFTLTGDLGFSKVGLGPSAEIVAVGNDVTVRMEVTSSVYMELAHADFGLIAGTGKFVFELQAGAGAAPLPGNALTIALNALEAYQNLGTPEGELALVQAAVYLATAPKSNALYMAEKAVKAEIEKTGR